MTTDTPRTDAAWKLTRFSSALLEHDGEICNEVFCTTEDEAECLVELLNDLTERAKKAEAERDVLLKENERLKAMPHFHHESYCRKCQEKLPEGPLKRVIRIASDALWIARIYENKHKFDEIDNLCKELDQIKSTL